MSVLQTVRMAFVTTRFFNNCYKTHLFANYVGKRYHTNYNVYHVIGSKALKDAQSYNLSFFEGYSPNLG